MRKSARLELEDGSTYDGFACGADGAARGEVVFNTSMVGYPESLTDPSYSGEILVFTYPLIGNYGVHFYRRDEWGLQERLESERMHVAGVVFAEPPEDFHHWNAEQSLDAWMKSDGVPGICGIDTRALTKRLRERGVMLGRIVSGESGNSLPFENPYDQNLVAVVSKPVLRTMGEGDVHIVVVDCGVKHSILRALLTRGAQLTVVPWDHDLSGIDYDGVVLSNGPGDPATVAKTVETVRTLLGGSKPLFGICLGHQLLARASGAATYKLRYGHRSHNQPCVKEERCYITSQNHGFAVDEKTLPAEFLPWFSNANDGTNEGIRHVSKPFFSVQFHPESCGGPLDTGWIFDDFLSIVRSMKGSR